jgi:hypothetical protein
VRRVQFSCFTLLDSFSAVPTSGLIFMFCASGIILGGTEDVGSNFHVLHSWNRFGCYLERRVQFSYFVLPDVFGGTEGVDQVFMFCAPGLIFRGTEGVGSSCNVFRTRNHFRRYRRRKIQFLYFALPNSFSEVPRVWGSVFMFCDLGLDFGGTESVESNFHLLRP